MPQTKEFFVDGIKTIAIHNDVARIQFMQLDYQGNPLEGLCLLVPMGQVKSIAEALQKLAAHAPAAATPASATTPPTPPAATSTTVKPTSAPSPFPGQPRKI